MTGARPLACSSQTKCSGVSDASSSPCRRTLSLVAGPPSCALPYLLVIQIYLIVTLVWQKEEADVAIVCSWCPRSSQRKRKKGLDVTPELRMCHEPLTPSRVAAPSDEPSLSSNRRLGTHDMASSTPTPSSSLAPPPPKARAPAVAPGIYPSDSVRVRPASLPTCLATQLRRPKGDR